MRRSCGGCGHGADARTGAELENDSRAGGARSKPISRARAARAARRARQRPRSARTRSLRHRLSRSPSAPWSVALRSEPPHGHSRDGRGRERQGPGYRDHARAALGVFSAAVHIVRAYQAVFGNSPRHVVIQIPPVSAGFAFVHGQMALIVLRVIGVVPVIGFGISCGPIIGASRGIISRS